MNGLVFAQKVADLWQSVHPGESAYFQCERISGYYGQWAYTGSEDGIVTYGDAWKSGNASNLFLSGNATDRNNAQINAGDEVFFDIGEFDDVVSVIGRTAGGRVLVMSTSNSGDVLFDLGNHIYVVYLDTISFRLRGVSRAHGENSRRDSMTNYIHGAIAAPNGDVNAVALAVIRGEYGNGADREAAFGGRYDEVMVEVNRILAEPSAPVDINVLADGVLNGDYGNGDDRVAALGDNYDAVMAEVNRRLAEVPAAPPVDVNAVALAVIRGEWGDGDDRRARLAASGIDYDSVQARVNEILDADSAANPTYTVQAGDSLSGIASRVGFPGGWEALYAKNAGVISNPNVIYEGQVLSI